ncbi:hypothetical protein, partial [Bizionia paragorgiae]|uniref:hypothetical protein n=1 Tax=Bizionia paragorgiae TaxID=283786 RepID=UPI00299F086F
MFIKRKPKTVNDTTRLSISLSLICCVLFTNCNYFQNKKAEKQMQDYTAYKDLHQHQGTENYEVITLFNENTQIKEALIETKQQLLTVIGSDEKTNHSERKKIDLFGNILGIGLISKTLKDGTMYGYDSYSNWLTNKDENLYKYIDPFTNSEINDPYKYNFENIENEEWLNTFKNLYDEASFVYLEGYDYHFKIEDKWYLIPAFKMAKNLDLDITSLYPEKINPEEIRMQPLQESMEALMKQNIIKVIDYVQMDSEQGIGLNP